MKPDVIRLGEYDWATEELQVNEEPLYSEPLDYHIEKLVFYPDFDRKTRYHDLTLVKINKDVPFFSVRTKNKENLTKI